MNLFFDTSVLITATMPSTCGVPGSIPIDRVYIYNEKDYRACAPEDWKDRIGEP